MVDTELDLTWEEKVDHAAFTLLVPAFAVWAMPALLSVHGPDAWRWAGGILQLSGFAIGVYGLQEKLARFTDRPTIQEWLAKRFRKAWRRIKMWFGWRPDSTTMPAEPAEYTLAGADARGTVRPGPEASLEHRVEILEEEIESLRSWVEQIQKKVREGRSELRGEIEAVRDDLHALEQRLEKLVTRVAVGSIHLEATGIFWFVLGVVGTTWSNALPGL